MSGSIYLRPTGVLSDAQAETAQQVEGALPLAGGPLAFMGLEIMQRAGAKTASRLMSLGEFFERDWGADTVEAARQLEALRSARPRLAGLSLDQPRIMGIVNVTPDSFSDGGRHLGAQAAIDHAFRLEDEGADILDIGGESTRPGAGPVPLAEELARVLPVIEGLAGKTQARLSVDTRKAEVMRQAAAAGADIINDVSALTYDEAALEAAAETRLSVILMHAQGSPATMQAAPRYADVLLDVFDQLAARIAACEQAGIARARLVVDPGIGFGKTLQHNLALLAGLSLFHALGVPVLVGASRKRFLGALTGVARPAERVHGSVAAALAAVAQGAQIVRVHDVAATRQALSVWRGVAGMANDGAEPGAPAGKP